MKGFGEWCRLKNIFNIKFYGMATFVMRSKDESTRNAPLLRCTCGHDGKYFGLFHVIVMGQHIVINSKFGFRKVLYHE